MTSTAAPTSLQITPCTNGAFDRIDKAVVENIMHCLATAELCGGILPLNKSLQALALNCPKLWSFMALHRYVTLLPTEIATLISRHIRFRNLYGLSVFSIVTLSSSVVLRAIYDHIPVDFTIQGPIIPDLLPPISDVDDTLDKVETALEIKRAAAVAAAQHPPTPFALAVRTPAAIEDQEIPLEDVVASHDGLYLVPDSPQSERMPNLGNCASVLRLMVVSVDTHELYDDRINAQDDDGCLVRGTIGEQWHMWSMLIRRFSIQVGPFPNRRFGQVTHGLINSLSRQFLNLFDVGDNGPLKDRITRSRWTMLNGCIRTQCGVCDEPAIAQRVVCSRGDACNMLICISCLYERVDADFAYCASCGECPKCTAIVSDVPHAMDEPCQLCPMPATSCSFAAPERRCVTRPVDTCVFCDPVHGDDDDKMNVCGPCETKHRAAGELCVECRSDIFRACAGKCAGCSKSLCHGCKVNTCRACEVEARRRAKLALKLAKQHRKKQDEERQRLARIEETRRREEDAQRRRAEEEVARRRGDPFELDNILRAIGTDGVFVSTRPHAAPVAAAVVERKSPGSKEPESKEELTNMKSRVDQYKARRDAEHEAELKRGHIRGSTKTERKEERKEERKQRETDDAAKKRHIAKKERREVDEPRGGGGGGGGSGGGRKRDKSEKEARRKARQARRDAKRKAKRAEDGAEGEVGDQQKTSKRMRLQAPGDDNSR